MKGIRRKQLIPEEKFWWRMNVFASTTVMGYGTDVLVYRQLWLQLRKKILRFHRQKKMIPEKK
jgi:hypothetical protein